MKKPKMPAIAIGIKMPVQPRPVTPTSGGNPMQMGPMPKKPLTGPQKAAIKYRDKMMGK